MTWGPEAPDLVKQLEAKGVSLWLDGGELLAEGHSAALSEDVVQMLRERRLDLLSHLRGESCQGVRFLPSGRVMWLLREPPEPRPTRAIL